MLILDTNVLSEALKPSPAPIVLEWLAAQQKSNLYTTSLTLAELLMGLELLPAGKRKAHISEAMERILESGFRGRILSFDDSSARVLAILTVNRRKMGRPVSSFDAMIAAIAISKGAAIATRNTKDFETCGISLINPWQQ
jgi:predicted nucleic acid-binding protein